MIRWRVTFIDAVTAKRIEVEARAGEAARELAWERLRGTHPTGLVAMDLVESGPVSLGAPLALTEDNHERDQGVHPSR